MPTVSVYLNITEEGSLVIILSDDSFSTPESFYLHWNMNFF